MSIQRPIGSPESCYSSAQASSPVAAAQRLNRVYEVAIEAARQKKPEGVCYCLSLLRHTLDPSHSPEIALSLSQLYRDCEYLLEKEEYPHLMEILEAIKGLWVARLHIDTLIRS